METYLRIIFDRMEQSLREELIARLSDAGFEGFEENDDALEAYIPQSSFDAAALNAIVLPKDLAYGVEEIPTQNWNAIWESGFQPVVIGKFAVVRAGFHDAVPGVVHDIIITPKMSFGTGHHATTSMMIEQMEGIDFVKKNVFDFGTGTGILSILAEKCGASEIVAMDIDEWSVTNAMENIRSNKCMHIRLEKGNKPLRSVTYDIILANINLNILLEHMPVLVEQLAQEGIILISGILQEDELTMKKTLAELGLHVTGKKIRDQWICMQFSR